MHPFYQTSNLTPEQAKGANAEDANVEDATFEAKVSGYFLKTSYVLTQEPLRKNITVIQSERLNLAMTA